MTNKHDKANKAPDESANALNDSMLDDLEKKNYDNLEDLGKDICDYLNKSKKKSK